MRKLFAALCGAMVAVSPAPSHARWLSRPSACAADLSNEDEPQRVNIFGAPPALQDKVVYAAIQGANNLAEYLETPARVDVDFTKSDFSFAGFAREDFAAAFLPIGPTLFVHPDLAG